MKIDPRNPEASGTVGPSMGANDPGLSRNAGAPGLSRSTGALEPLGSAAVSAGVAAPHRPEVLEIPQVEGVPAAGSLVLTVGYNGTDFAGFAEQPTCRTVAGELRRALEVLLRRPVEITCAGRTDAGVHGLGQRVSVPVAASELDLAGRRIFQGLTALTPDDISIRAVERGGAAFSARFSAVERRYRYRIATGPRPVLMAGRAWWVKRPLDWEAMDRAARFLEGEHDFRSFCKAISAEGRSTSRFIRSVQVHPDKALGEPLVSVDVAGNAFLHNMVRIMVGSLVEVGAHRRPPEWIGEALEARDRKAAGPTAPPHGLEFLWVEYPPTDLEPWR